MKKKTYIYVIIIIHLIKFNSFERLTFSLVHHNWKSQKTVSCC